MKAATGLAPALVAGAVLLGTAGCPATPRPADRATADADTMTPSLRAESEAAFIADELGRRIGAVPRMGWLVPPHYLIAGSRAERLSIFAAGTGIHAASYDVALPPDAGANLRREHHVACEGDTTLWRYRLADRVVVNAERVLYVAGELGADARGGLTAVPVRSEWMALVLPPLQAGYPGALLRDTAVAVHAEDEFYSFHALYDSNSVATIDSVTGDELPPNAQVREGLFLHSPLGRVLGYRIIEVEGQRQCDGCGVPAYADGLQYVFRVRNAFRLPGFPHPVLSSTRARSKAGRCP